MTQDKEYNYEKTYSPKGKHDTTGMHHMTKKCNGPWTKFRCIEKDTCIYVLYGRTDWKCGRCGRLIHIHTEAWDHIAVMNMPKTFKWWKVALAIGSMGVLVWFMFNLTGG